MAGYDPQKNRGRRDLPADEPAPVDGLLGPALDDDEGTGPVLAHDAGRPMVRQVLPVPPRATDDEPEHISDAPADDGPEPTAAASGAGPAPAEPEKVIDLDAEAALDRAATAAAPTVDQAPVVDDAPRAAPSVAPAAASASASPPAPGASSSTPARIAALVAAIVAIVLLVRWRRRRRA